jgi:hypothetical protein
MNIGKNILIPLIIIILFSLYLGINKTNKVNYKIPSFVKLDPTSIKNITIDRPINSIELYLDNGVWRLKPDDLRADLSKITKMISFMTSSPFIDMVSDTGNFQNYGLETGKYTTVGIRAKIDGTNTPIREFYIGNLNTSGSFTFIRSPKTNSVYTVSGNIKDMFEISKNELLDRQILNLTVDEVDKIELSSLDNTYTIEKTIGDESKDIWKTTDGIELNTNSIEQSLRYLSGSIFDSYFDSEYNNKNSSIFSLTLFQDTVIHSFSIIDDGTGIYKGRSSYAGKDFLLSENTKTQLIIMFNDLVEKKEK